MFTTNVTIKHGLDSSCKSHCVGLAHHSGHTHELPRENNWNPLYLNQLHMEICIKSESLPSMNVYPDQALTELDRIILTKLEEELKNKDVKLHRDQHRPGHTSHIMDDRYPTGTLYLHLSFTQDQLIDLNRRGELTSEFLAFTLVLGDARDIDHETGKRVGVKRLMLEQLAARNKWLNEREKTFSENGLIVNYFLVDPLNEIGRVFINHAGKALEVKSVKDTTLAKGLYITSLEGCSVATERLSFDDIRDLRASGKNKSLNTRGIYLTMEEARGGFNNSEFYKELEAEVLEKDSIIKQKNQSIINIRRTIDSKDKELDALKEDLVKCKESARLQKLDTEKKERIIEDMKRGHVHEKRKLEEKKPGIIDKLGSFSKLAKDLFGVWTLVKTLSVFAS